MPSLNFSKIYRNCKSHIYIGEICERAAGNSGIRESLLYLTWAALGNATQNRTNTKVNRTVESTLTNTICIEVPKVATLSEASVFMVGKGQWFCQQTLPIY